MTPDQQEEKQRCAANWLGLIPVSGVT